MNKSLLPPAKEVCKGYVFTRVCLSTGDLCPGGSPCRGEVSIGGVSVQGSVSVGGSLSRGQSLSRGSLSIPYQPYGNERAVRILLECILVFCINM